MAWCHSLPTWADRDDRPGPPRRAARPTSPGGSLAAVPRLLRTDPALAACSWARPTPPSRSPRRRRPSWPPRWRRSPSGPRSSSSPPPASTPSGWGTTWPACSRRQETPRRADATGRGRAARPGRRPAGVGDPALRAGEPRDRDDGPAPGRAPRAARRRRTAALPAPPRVIVAPVRALLQRLGPLEGTAPARGPPRRAGRRRRAAARSWWRTGYRREHQVEHRGEFAVRGRDRRRLPLHGRRAGAHRPVGRRGRPPDRVLRQRPALVARPRRRRALRLPGARRSPPALRAAAASLGRRAGPGGRRCGSASPTGEQFDGMESWLPFLDGDERVLPDLLAAGRPGRPGRAAAHPRPGRRSCSTRRPRWPRRWRADLGAPRRARRSALPAPPPALRPPARATPRPACAALPPVPEGPSTAALDGAALRAGGGGPGPPGRRGHAAWWARATP